MKVQLLLLFLIAQMSSSAVNAATIKGKVIDHTGETVIGATILEKGTTNGTVTDFEGNFTLESTNSSPILLISYVGYTTQTIKATAGTLLKISLTEDSQSLDELVVVGYGVQKRISMTGSVAAIDTKKLEKAPTDNLSNMIGGRVPGIVSRQTSGVPGENGAAIYIRGISTTSNSSPLVLVDGVERDYQNLDPSEIASITVLKDAASASVYGVKGANGVILVTTKRGSKSEKANVTYNGSFMASFNTSFPDFLDGNEYIHWTNKTAQMDNTTPEFSETEAGYVRNGNDPQGIFGNTNWFDLIFKPFAPGQSHTINVTGGNDNVKYFVGGSILDQRGIIERVSFNRYNLRSNIDIKLNKRMDLKFDVSGRVESTRQPGITPGSSDPSGSTDNGGATQGYKNLIYYAIAARPVVNSQTPDGRYIGYQNPLLVRDQSGFTNRDRSFVQTNIALNYLIPGIKGLKATGMFSYDFQNSLYKQLMLPFDQVTPKYGERDSNGNLALLEGKSPHWDDSNRLTESHSSFSRYTLQGILNYNNSFGKHDVSGDLVWEQSGAYSKSFSAAKKNLPITDIPDLNFGTEIAPNSVTGSHGQSGRAGMVVRGNYSYDDKYMLQASMRADWSAKFASDKRLGFFPSVSLGWRISQENFFESARAVVDNLKLRASWGQLGNDAISDFLFLQGMQLTTNPSVVFLGTPYQSLYTSSVPNRDITWERTSTYNIGAELSLWNGLLSFEGDAFYKVTSGILQQQSGQQPPSLGGNFPSTINTGIVDVRGLEIIVGHRKNINKDFNYNISGNFTFARNRIIKTDDSPNIPEYQKRIGQPLGSVMGYVSDGLYQTEEELIYHPKTSGAVRLGDIKYKDINGDGKITAEDRTWIAGSQIPEIMFGLNLDATYKWVDISLFFQGAGKTDIMLCGTYSALGYSDGTFFTQPFKWGSNPPKYLVEGSWTPENTNSEYPRLTAQSSSNNSAISDFWKRDATYLRLKNAQIGLSIPSKYTKKAYIDGLRIYVSGSNLFTLSKLSFIDPEAPSVNNGYYPQQRVFSFGINLTL